MPYPGPLHPGPLPLWQATADLYFCRIHSNTVLSQSLWGLWDLVHTRFAWVLWVSLAGKGFDSKCNFTLPTILLGLLLCPWTWCIFFLLDPTFTPHCHCSICFFPPSRTYYHQHTLFCLLFIIIHSSNKLIPKSRDTYMFFSLINSKYLEQCLAHTIAVCIQTCCLDECCYVKSLQFILYKIIVYIICIQWLFSVLWMHACMLSCFVNACWVSLVISNSLWPHRL